MEDIRENFEKKLTAYIKLLKQMIYNLFIHMMVYR